MIRRFAFRDLTDTQPSGITNRRKRWPSSIDMAIRCDRLPDVEAPDGILAQMAEYAGQNVD